jgi:arylsulfatase
VPERAGAANTHGVSYKVLAEIEIDDTSAQGVIMAQGSRFGGHALFIKDRRLHYVYDFVGLKPEQDFASEPLEPGKYVLGVEFVKESIGKHREALGTAKLYVGDDVVAEGPLRTQTGHFSLCGEGLSIGRDTGDAVSEQYTPFFGFEGGRVIKVEVSVGDDAYVDLEQQMLAALARD